MIIKQFVLRLKSLLFQPQYYFWVLIFPLILGTLFYVAFGNYMKNDASEHMDTIPVAVVYEASDNEEVFDTLLDRLSDDTDDNGILSVTKTDEKKAAALLVDDKVDGIITYSDPVRLTVSTTGINQTVLKTILDEYNQKYYLITEAAKIDPSSIQAISEHITDNVSYIQEETLGTHTSNPMLTYFYALIAMACMYASFFGVAVSHGLQGNHSALAARRIIAPIHKLICVICDFLAAYTICVAGQLVLFGYLVGILHIDFGAHIGLTLLTACIGSLAGLSFGMFIGSALSINQNAKFGITLGVSMVSSFLAGLMFSEMTRILEKSCPIVNRLNPATLISNSFYCLTYYNSYEKYISNMVALLIFSAVFIIGSVLFLRRKRYASI